jgi:type IV pilus assembly protein PilX
MHRPIQIRSRQRGAALVIGLLLLVILTLLAISGMNSASTELIMAGNEQFRSKALNNSWAGVEEALQTLPSAKLDKVTPTKGTKTAVTGGDASLDFYETSTQYWGEESNVTGFSAGRFSAFHFEVAATGTAARDSTSVQNQGAYVIQRSDPGAFGSIN